MEKFYTRICNPRMKFKWTSLGAHRKEGVRVCVQSLGIKPGGPHPGSPGLGKPRSCFNVNFNSYAHGSCSGTKVSLALFI